MRDPVLIGAEQVQSAASSMSRSADRMADAAAAFSGAVNHLDRVLSQFGSDMAAVLSRLEELDRGRDHDGR